MPLPPACFWMFRRRLYSSARSWYWWYLLYPPVLQDFEDLLIPSRYFIWYYPIRCVWWLQSLSQLGGLSIKSLHFRAESVPVVSIEGHFRGPWTGEAVFPLSISHYLFDGSYPIFLQLVFAFPCPFAVLFLPFDCDFEGTTYRLDSSCLCNFDSITGDIGEFSFGLGTHQLCTTGYIHCRTIFSREYKIQMLAGCCSIFLSHHWWNFCTQECCIVCMCSYCFLYFPFDLRIYGPSR